MKKKSLFLAVCLCSVLLLAGCGEINNVRDAVNNAASFTSEKADVYRAACDEVREQMHAPSETEFPTYSSKYVKESDVDLSDTNYKKVYEVTAYADSENAMGGTVRFEWKATVAVQDNGYLVRIDYMN